MLQMAYQPERWSEKIGDALGIFTKRIEGDLEAFKTFVEREGDHIEGWRGRVEALEDDAQRERRVIDPNPSAHFR